MWTIKLAEMRRGYKIPDLELEFKGHAGLTRKVGGFLVFCFQGRGIAMTQFCA